MSILIRGGTVVTAEGTLAADVLIAGEKIAAVIAREAGLPAGGRAGQVHGAFQASLSAYWQNAM